MLAACRLLLLLHYRLILRLDLRLTPIRAIADRTRPDCKQFRIIRDDPRLHRLLRVVCRLFKWSVARRLVAVDGEPPPRLQPRVTRPLSCTGEFVALVYEFELLDKSSLQGFLESNLSAQPSHQKLRFSSVRFQQVPIATLNDAPV